MEEYTDKVFKYFQKMDNMGAIESPDGYGKVGNAKCGDIMEMYLKIDNDKIVDAKFKTFGCVAAIATSAALTEMIKGKTIDEALQITKKDIIQFLGDLPTVKIHCSILGIEALKKAIKNYQELKIHE
ncbi:MAG TPA: iron-sulfur cluster assembly scaffold protein [Chlamydiales bacterium]|nr:iron-sulfur cluster assembly scaffold protein [Chlamydiales bacterium]